MITQGPGVEFLGDIELEDKLELSESCIIAPRKITMRVRGGGLGANAWVARITGPNDRYGVEREFVDANRDLSQSGKSGNITWEIDQDGVYEYRELCISSTRTTSGFFLIEESKVADLGNRKAGVTKWAHVQAVRS